MSTMDEEFGRDDCRRKEPGGGIEESDAGLFSHVRNMPEIPGDEVIDLVERRQRDVKGIGDELPVKDPARDVSLGEDGNLV